MSFIFPVLSVVCLFFWPCTRWLDVGCADPTIGGACTDPVRVDSP